VNEIILRASLIHGKDEEIRGTGPLLQALITLNPVGQQLVEADLVVVAEGEASETFALVVEHSILRIEIVFELGVIHETAITEIDLAIVVTSSVVMITGLTAVMMIVGLFETRERATGIGATSRQPA
jgi:hypothetical protein